MDVASHPEFVPAAWLRGGHAQTLGGFLFPGDAPEYRAVQRVVDLPDGDRIVLHEDLPDDWRDGDRTVLLVHGLGGSHLSPYMRRIAAKLASRGVCVFRMDLRGSGAGAHLARSIYHSGRTEDLVCALEEIARLRPDSPTTLAGFSLGGNLTLKLLGESKDRPPANLERGVAVNPPIDLNVCSATLSRPLNRVYDRYFASMLVRQVRERSRLVPDAVGKDFEHRPARLREFDDLFTAKVAGFGTVENYYTRCSSARFVESIELPTVVLTARDDPMIPTEPFEKANFSASTRVVIAGGGGHLGYIGRAGVDPDRRWMDWRVVDWANPTQD